MMNTIENITKSSLRPIPEIKPGDTVRVVQKIKEGNKERLQAFEGTVLAKKHGNGISGTITVRKVSAGVGVERIFPLHSPVIERIEVLKRAKVRRAKLYYLRDAKGRRARLKTRNLTAEEGIQIVSETETQENPEQEQAEQEQKEEQETAQQEEQEEQTQAGQEQQEEQGQTVEQEGEKKA